MGFNSAFKWLSSYKKISVLNFVFVQIFQDPLPRKTPTSVQYLCTLELPLTSNCTVMTAA